MSIENLDPNSDFGEIEEGSLIRLVEGAQPVIFEGIIENNNPEIGDMAMIIYLDPIEGLYRRKYLLYEDGALREWYSSEGIDEESEEGRKYLRLITGDGKNLYTEPKKERRHLKLVTRE